MLMFESTERCFSGVHFYFMFVYIKFFFGSSVLVWITSWNPRWSKKQDWFDYKKPAPATRTRTLVHMCMWIYIIYLKDTVFITSRWK